MGKNSWIKKLSKDKDYWMLNKIEKSNWPAPIVYEYSNLRRLISEGNVYGSLLQIRDLYEISIKIPVIMAIVYMDYFSEKKLIENSGIIRKLIVNPLSMGAWHALSSSVRKNAKLFSLPSGIIQILKTTEELYRKRVSNNVPNAVNWRNETIGHGALKFEDNEEYQEEFSNLLLNYKDYIQKCGIAAYDEFFFSIDDIALTGIMEPNPELKGSVVLRMHERIIPLGKFVSDKWFFLDSFYLRKRNIKYMDYYSGEERIKADFEFAKYIESILYENSDLDKNIRAEYLRRSDDHILGLLNQSLNYIVPDYIIDSIQRYMEEHSKGIIMLSMERGTGKSAFANHVDGLLNDPAKSLIEDAVVRTYSISNLQSRGLHDFIGFVNSVFSWSFDGKDDLRASEAKLPTISINDENPEQAFANFLNTYQSIYEEVFYIGRIVLVLDGIDEITTETKKIFEWIPASNLLNEGVFIICTTRFADEQDISNTAKRLISKLQIMADNNISFRRTSRENNELLRKYILKEAGNLNENLVNKLIELAEHRILYLKAFLPLYDQVVEGPFSARAIIEWYLM